MISKLMAISCTLLCLTLHAGEWECYECPNIVEPIYVYPEDQFFNPCLGWNSPFRLGLSHTEGKWYDVEVGYTTLSTFVAFVLGSQGDFIPFIDFRTHLFNDGKWAGNFGGGFRAIVDRSKNMFGMNMYYDFRDSKRGVEFSQIGIGFEFLTTCLDIRWNFYFLAGNKHDKSRTHIFDNYIGPYMAVCRDTRRALSGGDLEFGSWLVPRAPCQFVNLYGAFAPYYYSSKNHHTSHANGVYGIKGRLLTMLGEYFALELRAGYDRAYKGMVQATLTFNLPLDKLFDWQTWCGDCSRDDCRAYQPVVRQEMIVLSPKTCCWDSNF